MKDITQGTLIGGIRSTQYPGVIVYGIVISAACDLAQDKIDKVFYLAAIPIKEWLCSDKGFQIATAGLAKNQKKSLLDGLEKHGLSWEVAQTLSQEEFEVVAGENISNKSDRNSIINKFEKYRRLAKGKQTHKEKMKIYRDENKAISSFLEDIFNGGNTHYVFIPKQALSDQFSESQGLIVDLLELDYFPLDLVKKISDGAIDCRVMLEAEIDDYNKQFFLKEGPGFAYPMSEVLSPWREYLLQHFSNCFIRIGVDNPGKNETKAIVEDIFREEQI